MNLVELFRTPNQAYAFDAVRGSLLEIQDNTLEYLLTHEKVGKKAPAEIDELQKAGYLSGKSVIEHIAHPYSEILDVLLIRKISHITLQVTQQCNFRCDYCVYSEEHSARQRNHSNRKMNFDTAKKALDLLRKCSVDSASVNIGFYGGEPLLAFDLVQQVIEYSKEIFLGKPITYSMTTNGSLLSDSVIEYLVDNKVMLTVSLDGSKSIHDRNRHLKNGMGTYDMVMENVNKIRKRYPDYWNQVQYSMVMDPRNDYDEICEICHNEIIKSQNIQTSGLDLEFDGITVEPTEQYLEKYQYQIFLAFLSHWNRYPEKKVPYVSVKAVGNIFSRLYRYDIISPQRTVDIPAGPCIPGQMRMFCDIDGNLYPCERVSECSEAMKIGHIDTGIEVAKARNLLQVGKITEHTCKNCWCIRFCTQCAKMSDIGEKDLSPEARLWHCKYSKADAYNRMREYILIKEVHLYYKEEIRNSK